MRDAEIKAVIAEVHEDDYGAAVRLLLVENPRNMLSDDLDQAIGAGKKIVEIEKIVAGIFAIF